uniref:Olfactory receptor n=1 Tax=Nothobranchius furzeri TaxID=105023 RepID=A0A8C6LXV9_NOTFU
MSNGSHEFFIVGFPSLQLEYFQVAAWFFFILYVTTLVGNMILVVMFALEHNLQKPMYIIMVSLALSDIGFSTVALPKLIARYWWNDGSIGFYTCHFQRHMIHYFGSLNSLILLTMAVDRYLAICFPLRYPMMMTIQTITVLTVLCWAVAHIFPGITSISLSQMPFCGSNQIINAFCDSSSLVSLACGETRDLYNTTFSAAMVVLYVPLGFIVFSYIFIVISVSRMVNGQGRKKTFSTCATQGFIIAIYYVPRFFVYSAPYFPNLKMTPDNRIAMTLFYSLFPPLINPFVYCLRTKEIKEIVRRWIQRQKSLQEGVDINSYILKIYVQIFCNISILCLI